MSNIGIGAMIHHLCGGSPNSANEFYGKMISAVSMTEDEIVLTFSDGERARIWDNGQSCCENRYMTTDDNIQSLVGQTLVRIETKDGPDTSGERGEEHEIVFVELGTDVGFVTIANHNEHNGYYGGFGLSIAKVSA